MAKISKFVVSFLLFAFLEASESSAAAAVLRAVVRLNELEGKPMADVSISADGAQPTVTDNDGRFDLLLPNKRPGDVVDLSLIKDGYVVVHSIMLQPVLLADTNALRIPILMAKEVDREAMAVKYFRLKSEEALQTTYQQKLEELEHQHKADATAMAELKQELEESKTAAGRLAEELAQEKPGEKSPMYEEAMRLFLGGMVDEALAVLDEAKLQQRKVEVRQADQELARDYQLKGQLLTLKFRFTEAADAYASAVEVAPEDFDANFALGAFHQYLNHPAEALTAYQRSLEIARKSGIQEKVVMVLNNLGNLDRDENRKADARDDYERALKIGRKLADQDPDTYLPEVARTLTSLGNLDREENRSAEARNDVEEAVTIYRRLAEHNPDIYMPYVAATLQNLGILDHKENRKVEARKDYEESLEIWRQLAKHNVYLPNAAAGTLNNIGSLEWDENRKAEARKDFEEALKIVRQLAEHNPGYQPDLALTLNNLGISNNDEHRNAEARKDYEEALKIRRQFAERNPERYLPDVAETLCNLGILDSGENRKTEARMDFEEALKIYGRFAKDSPSVYGRHVEQVQRLLDGLSN